MKIEQSKEQYNKLTQYFLKSLAENGGNIVFSPYSIITLLGMALQATDGASRDEIIQALLPGMKPWQAIKALEELQASLASKKEVSTGNAVCVREDYAPTIKAGYRQELRKVFSGQLFSSKDIVGDVNAWVKEQTQEMIPRMLDESLNGLLFCQVNAISFVADWDEAYSNDDIISGDFTNADGSISEVDMLQSTEHSYIENATFRGFIKPYKKNRFSYMALIPKDEDAELSLDMIGEIDFSQLYSTADYKKVNVTMPEFTCDFSQEINNVCKALGINTIFTNRADFSNMSEAPLKVDMILHKAHIEVNRRGTRAAAASAMILIEGTGIMLEDFECVDLDRPFVYAVMDNETRLPVFAGVVRAV